MAEQGYEIDHILVLNSLIHVARGEPGAWEVRRYYEFSEATHKRCEKLKNCYEHVESAAGALTINNERLQTDRFRQIGVE